jgi:hypothetical protein
MIAAIQSRKAVPADELLAELKLAADILANMGLACSASMVEEASRQLAARHELTEKVAQLNPAVAEIGAGMLAHIVSLAKIAA